MATLLQFPSRQIQVLSFLEQKLQELLQSKGADEELIEFAGASVRDIYHHNTEAENYSFDLPLPEGISEKALVQLRADIQAGIEGIREENHAIIVRLIAELTLAHVRIFQYERGH